MSAQPQTVFEVDPLNEKLIPKWADPFVGRERDEASGSDRRLDLQVRASGCLASHSEASRDWASRVGADQADSGARRVFVIYADQTCQHVVIDDGVLIEHHRPGAVQRRGSPQTLVQRRRHSDVPAVLDEFDLLRDQLSETRFRGHPIAVVDDNHASHLGGESPQSVAETPIRMIRNNNRRRACGARRHNGSLTAWQRQHFGASSMPPEES